jgi:hypothetical protein
MFFSCIFQGPKSFIETKLLINYQGHSAEAEPINGPFLQCKTQTTGPKKHADDGARGQRKTENATEPFLSRPPTAWQGVSNAFKDGKGGRVLWKLNG